VEDWLPLLPEALREVLGRATRYFSAGVLIGPAGSVARLHTDFLHTHAYLAQIAGRKRCTLFSPEDSAFLYEGRVDPDAPNLDEFPLFRQATAFECTLEPGELLFMPWRWWHHVVALEKSITVNYNFFNRVNFTSYFNDLLKYLPSLVNGLENCPAEKATLGIDWKSRGFDFSQREHV
jgi:ribosomal protein L16 Arg81 hydroxylase